MLQDQAARRALARNLLVAAHERTLDIDTLWKRQVSRLEARGHIVMESGERYVANTPARWGVDRDRRSPENRTMFTLFRHRNHLYQVICGSVASEFPDYRYACNMILDSVRLGH